MKKESFTTQLQRFSKDVLIAAIFLYVMLLILNVIINGFVAVFFPLELLGYGVLGGIVIVAILKRRQ